LTSEDPIAWRVSWTFWQGYSATKKKSKPQHRDFRTRDEAEAHKHDLIGRYTAVTACVSPRFIAPRELEQQYAGRQRNIAEQAN
jgi:hypothetical protein